MSEADAFVVLSVVLAATITLFAVLITWHNRFNRSTRSATRSEMLRLFGLPDDTPTQPLSAADMPIYRRRENYL